MSAIATSFTFPEWVAFSNAGFIQSAFGWAYFNLQAFYWNVYMRQQQKYQQKNYQIAWTYIARRDILNMMGLTVRRMSNYMVVSAVLFSAAATIGMSAKFLQETHPFECELDRFIMISFYTGMATSSVLFITAILIAVEGQNLACTETMKLLTFHVRPENPADYNHDYMQQAQWVEKLGLATLFRVPGLMPDYEDHLKGDAAASGSKPDATKKNIHLEDITFLENCDIQTHHAAYLAKFAEYARVWVAFDEYSKYCVGVACIELAEGMLCWILGWLSANNYPLYAIPGASWTLVMSSLIAIMLNHYKVFSSRARFVLYGAIVASSCMSAVSALSPPGTVKEICYPFCFFVHVFMYGVILYLGFFDERVLAEQATVKRSFWNSNDKWYSDETLFSETSDYSSASADGKSACASDQRQPESNHGAKEETNTIDDVDKRTFGSFQELEKRVRKNIALLRKIVRTILFGLFGVWLVIGISAAHYAWILYTDEVGKLALIRHAKEHERFRVDLETPSMYFQLNAITCTENTTIVSDHHNIFQMRGSSWMKQPCKNKGVILDVATSCNRHDCWPVALISVEPNSSRLLDCRTGEVMPFLQEATPVLHFAVRYEAAFEEGLKRQKLIGEHAGKVIQYRWSHQRAGWEPEWTLLHDQSLGDTTKGLGTSQNHLLVFHDAEVDHPAMKRYDLGTMELKEDWIFPLPIIGGCVFDKDGRDMMALIRKDPFAGEPSDLARISLDAGE